MQFLLIPATVGIMISNGIDFYVFTVCKIYVAYIAVVEGQVGSAEHCTAFAAAVGITLNGRHACIVAVVAYCCISAQYCLNSSEFVGIALVFAYADIHMGCAQDVNHGRTVRDIADGSIHPFFVN